MHRDMKLGLVLGVLLIGFAAAFCFPRQQVDVPELALEEAAALDARIELLPVRSYTRLDAPAKEVAAEPHQTPSEPSVAPPASEGALLSETGLLPTAPDPIPLASDAPRPNAQEVSSTAVQSTAVHSTIPSSDAPVELPPAAHPPASSVSSIPTVADPGTKTAKNTAPPVGDGGFYEVQSGDTLSGIAYRLLGSSLRYRVIYEANRDIMPSADRIKVGMRLRIPSSTPPATSLPPSAPQQTADASEQLPASSPVAPTDTADATHAEPESRFRPASRRPTLAIGFEAIEEDVSPLAGQR